MAETKRTFRLGRTPRAFDPRVPHMSALLAGKTLPPPPPLVDYTKGMPLDLGMMLIGTFADCSCVVVYHAIEVWSYIVSNGKNIDTEPDGDVEKLYELACGYNPKTPGSHSVSGAARASRTPKT